MIRRAQALIASLLVSAALGACDRSEELGHLSDAAVGDDAHVDSACQGKICSAPLGFACTMASECASGFCVGGVCCDTACTASGMTCVAAGSAGTCTAGTPPPPRANGVACKQPSDCASGFCVDGVCCNTACTDSAMTCGAAGSVGTCTATTTTQALGTSCTTAAQCASGFCADGVCCDTACTASSMTCDAVGSVGTCITATTSTPQANGTPCKQASECASGFCVGAVCCNTACSGSCVTCGAAGAVGTCTPATSCP